MLKKVGDGEGRGGRRAWHECNLFLWAWHTHTHRHWQTHTSSPTQTPAHSIAASGKLIKFITQRPCRLLTPCGFSYRYSTRPKPAPATQPPTKPPPSYLLFGCVCDLCLSFPACVCVPVSWRLRLLFHSILCFLCCRWLLLKKICPKCQGGWGGGWAGWPGMGWTVWFASFLVAQRDENAAHLNAKWCNFSSRKGNLLEMRWENI